MNIGYFTDTYWNPCLPITPVFLLRHHCKTRSVFIIDLFILRSILFELDLFVFTYLYVFVLTLFCFKVYWFMFMCQWVFTRMLAWRKWQGREERLDWEDSKRGSSSYQDLNWPETTPAPLTCGVKVMNYLLPVNSFKPCPLHCVVDWFKRCLICLL